MIRRQLSKQFIDAVKSSSRSMAQIAIDAKVKKYRIYAYMNGNRNPRKNDPLVIAIGAVVGVPADECFDPKPTDETPHEYIKVKMVLTFISEFEIIKREEDEHSKMLQVLCQINSKQKNWLRIKDLQAFEENPLKYIKRLKDFKSNCTLETIKR